MSSSRPVAEVTLPRTIVDPAEFATHLREVVAGVLGDVDLAPGSLRVKATDDDLFMLTVGGRPALVELSTTADTDALLDKVALRLLRRLDLWSPTRSPLRGVDHYLMQLGMGPVGSTGGDEPAAVEGERLLDLEAPAEIRLEVPAGVARQVEEPDTDAMINLRKDVFRLAGVELPEVRVTLTEPQLRRIRIGLNSTFVTVRDVPPDAGWGYVIDSLRRTLEGRLHWFIRMEQVERTLEDLRYVVPDLVDSCRLCYPTGVLTACLRELVRHGHSLRNLNRIMWLLLDLGSGESGPDHFLMAETPLPRPGHATAATSRDPVALASRIRKCVREEAWRVGVAEPLGRAGRLSPEIEHGLQEASDVEEAARYEWSALTEYAELGGPDVVLVRSVEAIGPVFDALQCLPAPPKVIASQELPPDTELADVPVAATSSR